MDSNPSRQRRPQITTRKKTRPRRALPSPMTDSAEVLAEAVFSLPERHTWVFMRGKSFRD